MGNFNDRGNRGGGFRGGNGGGRPNFKKGGFGGGNRDHQMHKAVCDECGNSCEVPFRPSSDKPIYCDNCFKDKRGNEAPRRDFNNDRGPKKDFGGKPNFSKPTNQSNNDDLKKQLNEMNSKLDRLVNALEKMQAPRVEVAASKPVVKAVPVVKKVEAKKVVKPAAKVTTKAPAKKVEVKKPATKKAAPKKKK